MTHVGHIRSTQTCHYGHSNYVLMHVNVSGVGRGGGSWCSSAPFLPQTVQEVYLKDPAEHGATSFGSGLSEVVACLPVS